ncbi:glycosyltransferase family 4 protein [Ferribacterium limneticum]|uniref:glycosyltransferase family 4 protein n=1 Tax=Ferribacterium limneticum TaxID=76259 RepID=UPI001CFAB16A|nr:glycosyltransferase family 1 protein [Ferribacterium limneticum]UCV20752.1 glycosyltransferase family 4 protein [Ferribacterium limneticum]
MLLAWLESLKKLPHIPAVIERHSVAKARNAIQPVRGGSNPSESTLWVDISVISRRDAGSGIQRVVRALLAELQVSSIAGWRIQPVAATPRQPYRAVPWQIPTVNLEKCPKIEPQAGDVFLGLDLSAHIIPRHQKQMAAWKSRGLKLAFVIYDLLPLQFPQWFSAKLVRAFRRWIKSVAILADQVFCISPPVKQDFENLMQSRYGLQPGAIPANVFPMGADIKASKPSAGLPEGFSGTLNLIMQGKAALMVGTVEPRKGYGEMLNAFEHLWAKGRSHKLVIVGRPGWMTDGLQRRITANPYLNDRLFWFDNASDEALNALYENCTGVIAASFAEGYGLPLLEALGQGKSVLARDLAVFRQFHTPLVSYFAADANTETIGAAVELWFDDANKLGKLERSVERILLPTWRASLNSLLGQLLPDSYSAERYGEFA